MNLADDMAKQGSRRQPGQPAKPCLSATGSAVARCAHLSPVGAQRLKAAVSRVAGHLFGG